MRNYKLYHALSRRPRASRKSSGSWRRSIGPAPPTATEAQGRVLADLYFEQGHFAGGGSPHTRDSGAPTRATPGLDRRKAGRLEHLAAAGREQGTGEPEAAHRPRSGFETLVERDTKALTPGAPGVSEDATVPARDTLDADDSMSLFRDTLRGIAERGRGARAVRDRGPRRDLGRDLRCQRKLFRLNWLRLS